MDENLSTNVKEIFDLSTDSDFKRDTSCPIFNNVTYLADNPYLQW